MLVISITLILFDRETEKKSFKSYYTHKTNLLLRRNSILKYREDY